VCAADGCKQVGTKLCSRCGAEAYCSAECQRRRWREHKLVCQKVDSPENEVDTLLRAGKLYSARERLQQLSKASARLSAELDDRIKAGIYSEIVDGRLQLAPVEGFGMGYVAAKDIQAGDPLLFDTAFAWAPVSGDKEFHFVIAERALRRGRNAARRTNVRVDAQADFFHHRIKALPTKGNMDRKFLEENDAVDDDVREQILVCSIAEGCCLYCTEEADIVALFAAAAFFNHSCAPNALLESTRTTALVRAARPIAKGEEVTISYLPVQLLADASSRRQRLEGGRGFACRCARCAEEGLACPPPPPQEP